MNNSKILVPIEKSFYEVYIDPDLLHNIGKELIKIGYEQNTKILIISNKEIADIFGSKILASLEKLNLKAEIYTIKSGEKYKTLNTLSEIYDSASKFGLGRDSLMIALGGGIVGDITGLAAATWLRGVDYVQVPTTLLSMVDSSVGGKTAVNHPNGKNLIGAFYQPKAVFIDTKTLNTLPAREFKAGMAEIIKYGVIDDEDLFKFLESKDNIKKILNLKNDYLVKIIRNSVETKSKIVSLDEKEQGIRAKLNYGHSFGHVIENLCGYGNYLHGEAISIGMRIAGKIAFDRGLWETEDAKRQNQLLKAYGLPTKIPKMDKKEIIRVLMGDKKVKGGKMRFILPTGIGSVDIFDDVKESEFLSYF